MNLISKYSGELRYSFLPFLPCSLLLWRGGLPWKELLKRGQHILWAKYEILKANKTSNKACNIHLALLQLNLWQPCHTQFQIHINQKIFQFGTFSRNDLKDLAKNNLLAITLSKLSHRQITSIQKSCYLC